MSFSTSEENVAIFNTDDNIVVLADSDYDGIYDIDVNHIHTYSYTDNGDGTHTKYCTAGDDTSVEIHTYVDGVCICGAAQIISTVDSGICGADLTWTLDSKGTLSITGTGEMDFWKNSSDVPWYDSRDNITKLVIGSGVTSISPDAFYGCTNLSDVSLPDTLIAIGTRSFLQCTSLCEVTLPEHLIYIGTGAFDGCEKLKEIVIPNTVCYAGAYEWSYGCTFEYCEAIYGYTNSAAYWYALRWEIPFKSLGNLSQGDLGYIGGELIATGQKGDNVYWALYEDGHLFFCGTGKMDETDVGNSGSAELLSSYHSAVKQVTFTEGITSIGAYTLASGRKAGNGNKTFEALTRIDIADSVVTIGERAFYECPALQSITIGSGVSSIGNYVFSYDNALSQIIVSDSNSYFQSKNNVLFSKDGVTLYRYPHNTDSSYTIPNLTEVIAMDAFGDCTTLTSISIPVSVTQIMTDAFDGCSNLTDVYYAGVEADWEKIEIGSGNTCMTSASIHYTGITPDEEVENPFTDVKESAYYYDAVLWAYKNDIAAGITSTSFRPEASCTRAQVVTFIWRAMGRPEPKTIENPFTDVKESEYYYNAVLWAYENGITSGTTETLFSPTATCTRGQIVTFLYRAMER